MSWTTQGTSSWGSNAADGSSVDVGSRSWPAGANTTGDLGILTVVMPGTGSPNAHADWTLIGSSVDADTAGSGLRSTYVYAHIYAGSAPNVAWNPAVPYCAGIQTYRHSTETDYTFGTAASEKNPDSTTHELTGGIASIGTDSLIVCVGSNGRAQQYSNLNSTAPTTASGSTDTSTAPSTSAWIERYDTYSIGSPFSALAHFDCVLNSGGTGDIATTVSAGTKGTVLAIAIKPGVTPLITVTNPTERTVYEGSSGSATVALSGTYTGASEAVEVRIIESIGGAVVVDWTTIDASTSGGTWSGTVSVPRGGWYDAVVRKATSTGVTGQTTSRWGVGLVIGALGQSHLDEWALEGSGTPDDRACQVASGSSTRTALSGTGAGRCAFANALITLADCPVMIVDAAQGGTLITYWYTVGGGTTAPYDAWAARVTAAGGELSAWVWWQGDADAQAGTSRATYQGLLDDLQAKVASDFGAPLTLVGILGRYVSGNDTDWGTIRKAHVDWVFDDADRRGLVTLDLAQDGDGQHFTSAGHVVAGGRMAQLVSDWLGTGGSGIGMQIASAAYSGTAVVAWLTHDGGSDFTPTSGITGFRVLDNGTPATISSAVRAGGGAILLTVSAPLSGPVTVQYGYGAYPATTTGVVDNTAQGMPLYSTDADVTASFGLPTGVKRPLSGNLLAMQGTFQG